MLYNKTYIKNIFRNIFRKQRGQMEVKKNTYVNIAVIKHITRRFATSMYIAATAVTAQSVSVTNRLSTSYRFFTFKMLIYVYYFKILKLRYHRINSMKL